MTFLSKLGQEFPGLNPRHPEPGEVAIWENFKRYFSEVTTPAVWAAIKTGEVCGVAQQWFNQQGIPIICWDAASQARIDDLIDQANKVQRLIHGAETQKYYVSFPAGDVSIVAPPDMQPVEYQDDIVSPTLSGLIGGLIVVSIIATTMLLLGGGALYAQNMSNKAQQQQRDYTMQMQNAAAQMAQQPPAVQQAFQRMMKANEPLINSTAVATGDDWWTSLMSGLKKGAGVAIVVLLGFLAVTFLGKARSAGLTTTNNGRAAA